MTTLRTLAIGLACGLISAGAWAQAGTAGLARGQALYEARCDRCHDSGVHQRATRVAKTFAQVRDSVVRWDRELGAVWRSEEIDLVTRYLNNRYYAYPCPKEICGAERAAADVGGMSR